VDEMNGQDQAADTAAEAALLTIQIETTTISAARAVSSSDKDSNTILCDYLSLLFVIKKIEIAI
jgi:hypothetical protein